jgi:hypothetical protein
MVFDYRGADSPYLPADTYQVTVTVGTHEFSVSDKWGDGVSCEVPDEPDVPEDGPLVYVGNGHVNLGKCEGDCDRDSDCQGDLQCFQRSGTTPVPGCLGDGKDGTAYCYEVPADPDAPEDGELVYVGNGGVPADKFPLGKCEGDCDNDSECQGDLRCFLRSGFEPVPGCTGEGLESTDYCYDPMSDVPEDSPLVDVGDNGVPADQFPLGECEGDCDGDSECQGDLQCFQRSGLTPVPGCTGDGSDSKDYCYDPGRS